jgi:activator of 2-hydroxyglutaryl-CoA dehydratase
MEPEFTLVGGILRFERMVKVVANEIGAAVNVPPGDLVQYVAALGAALLGRRRLEKLQRDGTGSQRPAAVEG